MGLLNFLFPDSSSDGDFDNQLKKLPKEYPHCDAAAIEKLKLSTAFNHHSPKSAFWWFEHLAEKPICGSMEDVALLSHKYNYSFNAQLRGNKKVAPRQQRLKFLDMTLPDKLDYSDIIDGVSTKSEFLDNLLKFYEENCETKFKHRDMSPYMLPQYWQLFHRDAELDENGKLVQDENGKNAYSRWIEELRLYCKEKGIFLS